MEKINQISKAILAFTFVALMAAACGKKESSIDELIASGDLDAVRAKLKELTGEQKMLRKDIDRLDSVIGAKTENKNLPLVSTLTAKLQNFNHYVELQGDVSTKQNVLIYPEMSGNLIRVYVEKGQKVKKGQLLATIDDGGMKSQLIQMETQLALAKTTYERQKNLWEKNIGSEIQYLQAKASYESQENAVKQMESQIAKFSINAPFAGIIDDVIKDQGTVVAPGGLGSEIFRIVNLSNMYIEVFVPESYLTSITPGKDVKVFFPVLNESMDTKIRETGNFINPDNRSFTVEIPVSNKNGTVKPNLTAKVQINDYTNESAILIPQSVVSENAEGDQYIYVASGLKSDKTAKAERKIITTGKTQGDFVEVLSGINSGENIIIEGARTVKNGQTIKILSQKS